MYSGSLEISLLLSPRRRKRLEKHLGKDPCVFPVFDVLVDSYFYSGTVLLGFDRNFLFVKRKLIDRENIILHFTQCTYQNNVPLTENSHIL